MTKKDSNPKIDDYMARLHDNIYISNSREKDYKFIYNQLRIWINNLDFDYFKYRYLRLLTLIKPANENFELNTMINIYIIL